MAELKQCNEGDLEISSQLEIYPPPPKKKIFTFYGSAKVCQLTKSDHDNCI